MRLTSIRFSVSLSLLHGLSKWMRLIYYSLWMIRLDELLEVKSLKNLFKKLSYKMKDEKGWPQQTLVQF